MSTTNGNMKSFRVTDQQGNVYILTPVDSVARTAANSAQETANLAKTAADSAVETIEEAKDLSFDSDFFSAEESETEVNIRLNGVPFGVDDNTPLEIVQDTQEGIVLGSKAPFATALAPAYDSSSVYNKDAKVVNFGKLWNAKQNIQTAEEWNPEHWDEISICSLLENLNVNIIDLGTKT